MELQNPYRRQRKRMDPDTGLAEFKKTTSALKKKKKAVDP